MASTDPHGTTEPCTFDFRFCARAIPKRYRLEGWKAFGESTFGTELEPLSDGPLRAVWSGRLLPGLAIAWAAQDTSPWRVVLPSRLIPQDADTIAFQWGTSARFGTHLGREVEFRANDAVIVSGSDPAFMAFPEGGRSIFMSMPRSAFGELLRDKDGSLAKPLPGKSAAMRLLLRYLEVLRTEPAASQNLARLTTLHVYDLLAVAVGATKDAAELSRRGGVRAAQLAWIKSDIRANAASGPLSIAAIAAKHRLSVHQVQRLFESENITFTGFVREQRLTLCYRMLASPRFSDRSIAEIAYEGGFNDLSYFNRSFRARFGITPSDARHLRPLSNI